MSWGVLQSHPQTPRARCPSNVHVNVRFRCCYGLGMCTVLLIIKDPERTNSRTSGRRS